MLLLQALQAQRRRRARQELSAFAALIAAPADLAAGVVLPANGTLYVSCAAALVSTTVLATVGARDLGAKASGADVRHCVGWLERGRTVELAPGAPGVVSLFVEDDIGTLYKIAEA